MTLEWIDLVFLAGLALVLAASLVAWIVLFRGQWAVRRHDQTKAILARNLRRVAVLIGGTCILLLGVLISPLPGPGFSVLGPIGLALMATEFVWAQRLINRLEPMIEKTDRLAAATPLWLVAVAVIGYWVGAVAFVLWGPLEATRWLWIGVGVPFVPIGFWAFRSVMVRAELAKNSPTSPTSPTSPADPADPAEPGHGTTESHASMKA